MSNWVVDTDKVRQLLDSADQVRCLYKRPLLLAKHFNGEVVFDPVTHELGNEVRPSLSLDKVEE